MGSWEPGYVVQIKVSYLWIHNVMLSTCTLRNHVVEHVAVLAGAETGVFLLRIFWEIESSCGKISSYKLISSLYI